MITMLHVKCRSFEFWAWQLPQNDYEATAMNDDNGAVRKMDFPCSHSNILEIDKSRMLKSQQMCHKNEGCQREAKPADANELPSAQL